MNANAIVAKLEGLRTELVDLAYVLESRRRHDAADLATTTATRLGELCLEIAAGSADQEATEKKMRSYVQNE